MRPAKTRRTPSDFNVARPRVRSDRCRNALACNLCVDVCPVEDCITMVAMEPGSVDPRTGKTVQKEYANWDNPPEQSVSHGCRITSPSLRLGRCESTSARFFRLQEGHAASLLNRPARHRTDQHRQGSRGLAHQNQRNVGSAPISKKSDGVDRRI